MILIDVFRIDVPKYLHSNQKQQIKFKWLDFNDNDRGLPYPSQNTYGTIPCNNTIIYNNTASPNVKSTSLTIKRQKNKQNHHHNNKSNSNG